MTESKTLTVFVTCGGRSFKVRPVVALELCADHWEARSPLIHVPVTGSSEEMAESNMSEEISNLLHDFEDVSVLLHYFDTHSLDYEFLENWRF